MGKDLMFKLTLDTYGQLYVVIVQAHRQEFKGVHLNPPLTSE